MRVRSHRLSAVSSSSATATFEQSRARTLPAVLPRQSTKSTNSVPMMPRYQPIRTTADGAWNVRFVADILDCAKQHKPLFIAAAWGGNEHYIQGAVNSPRQSDFPLPDRPNLPLVDGAEIVPYDLLARRSRKPAGAMSSLWELLQSCCGLPIYHLAAPPPGRSTAIASHLPPHLRQQAEAFGVTAPSFRYKVWRLIVELKQEPCEAVGARFLWPPAQAIDADGMICDKYAGEGIHGNRDYGALVVGQFDRLVQGAVVQAGDQA